MAAAVVTQEPATTGGLPWMNRRSRKRYNLDLQVLSRPILQAKRKDSTPSIASSSEGTDYSGSSVVGVAGGPSNDGESMSAATSIHSIDRVDSAVGSPVSPPRLKTRSSSRRLASALPNIALNTSRFSSRRSIFQPSPIERRCSDDVVATADATDDRSRSRSNSPPAPRAPEVLDAEDAAAIAAARADLVALFRAQIEANQAQIEANAARMAQIKAGQDRYAAAIHTRLVAVERVNETLNALRTHTARLDEFQSAA